MLYCFVLYIGKPENAPITHKTMQKTVSSVDASLLLMVTFIWGSNFVVMKLGLLDFAPLLICFLRFTLSALPLIFFIKKPAVPMQWVATNGLLIGCGQFGCLFLALQGEIAPGLASLLMQLQVFLTIIASSFVFSEKVSNRQTAGLLAAMAGLVLAGWHIGGDLTVRGLVLVLAATAFWALSNLLVKQVSRQAAVKIDMLSFIAWSSFFSILPLAVMVLLTVGPDVALQQLKAASWLGWSAVLWQALGNTLIGFGLWSFMLAKYPASVVTPWALLVPIFGMTSSALYFGESFPPWKFAVFALVMGGIALASWPLRKKVVLA